MTFAIRHCCARAATLNYPQCHLDMIRPGIPSGWHPDPSTLDIKLTWLR